MKKVVGESFSCVGPEDGEHPRVYYFMPESGEVRCGYCNELFVRADFYDHLQHEKELLNLSTQESYRQRDERLKKSKT